MSDRLAAFAETAARDPWLEPPMGLLAELTHRCPLQCPYCSNPLDLEKAAGELTTLLGASAEERDLILKRVHEIEASSGEATHAIVQQVNGSFVTPFDRADMHGLADHDRTRTHRAAHAARRAPDAARPARLPARRRRAAR